MKTSSAHVEKESCYTIGTTASLGTASSTREHRPLCTELKSAANSEEGTCERNLSRPPWIFALLTERVDS